MILGKTGVKKLTKSFLYAIIYKLLAVCRNSWIPHNFDYVEYVLPHNFDYEADIFFGNICNDHYKNEKGR